MIEPGERELVLIRECIGNEETMLLAGLEKASRNTGLILQHHSGIIASLNEEACDPLFGYDAESDETIWRDHDPGFDDALVPVPGSRSLRGNPLSLARCERKEAGSAALAPRAGRKFKKCHGA